MSYIQQIIFIIAAAAGTWLFIKKAKQIRRNILLGKKDPAYNDRKGERWKMVLLLALGQKKMFKKPMVAFLHILIYVGFIIINIEVLEIVIDGAFGTHRLFLGLPMNLYPFLINAFEILAIGVLLACILFLARRNIL